MTESTKCQDDASDPIDETCPVPRQLTNASLRKMLARSETADGRDFQAKLPGAALVSIVSELLWHRECRAPSKAEQAPPWDEGVRDAYFSKLPGDARLVAGLDPLEPSTPEIIARLRKAVNAAVFGLPGGGISVIQADITELEKRLGGEHG